MTSPGPLSVLPPQTILALQKRGVISIDEFSKDNLTPYGYSVTCSDTVVVFMNTVGQYVISRFEDELVIQPNDRIMIKSKEKIRLPNDIMAIPYMRTSLARAPYFLIGAFDPVDPGFDGVLTLPFIHLGFEPIRLRMGEPIATLVFVQLNEPTSIPYPTYKRRYKEVEQIALSVKSIRAWKGE